MHRDETDKVTQEVLKNIDKSKEVKKVQEAQKAESVLQKHVTQRTIH